MKKEIRMQKPILAKQPILDRDGQLYGYELLSRSGSVNPTQEIIYQLLSKNDFHEEVPLFINVDYETLMGESCFLLPKEVVVFEILEDVDLSQKAVLERIWKLKEEGFRIALDDFVCNKEQLSRYEEYWPLFDMVKFDALDEGVDEALLYNVIEQLKQYGITLLAEKVEKLDIFLGYKKLGFDLFQGYYFAKPVEYSAKEVEANRMKILELISLIDEGKSPAELEESVKQDAQLTIELLQFINSPYFMIKNEIDSIRKAILMIGITRFKQWLFLLLYAAGGEDFTRNPLFQLVLQRARAMTALSQEVESLDEGKAFLTGVLSAADVLMKMPMREILERFKIDAEVKEALLERKNRYGKLLLLVMANELGNQKAVESVLQELGIAQERFADVMLETMLSKSGLFLAR